MTGVQTCALPILQVTSRPWEGGAVFELVSWVRNADENFTVQYSVLDGEGREAASAVRPADSTRVTVYVPDAVRWDPDNPYLYTVTAVLQRRNEAYDQVRVKAGVRSFSCDPERGFCINGAWTPLRGVSRHQDRLYRGNALTKEEHYEDAELDRKSVV